MTEIPGPEPDQPTFSHADDLEPSDADPSNRAEINAELGLEAGLENAKPYFQRLVAELKEPLQSGAYSSILGDDVTGRIPALVVGDVANKFADEQARPHPYQLFFAGGSPGYATPPQAIKLAKELETGEPQYRPGGTRKVTGLDREQREAYRDTLLSEYIDKIHPQLGERTLIVTDHVWMGRSIDSLAKLLHENGVAFDIATLGTNGDPQKFIDERANRPEFAGTKWFTGGDQTEQGILYSRDDELGENQLRQAIGTEKDWLKPIAKRGDGFDGTKVRTARKYLASYSADLYLDITD
jgi:hypothetical protein